MLKPIRVEAGTHQFRDLIPPLGRIDVHDAGFRHEFDRLAGL